MSLVQLQIGVTHEQLLLVSGENVKKFVFDTNQKDHISLMVLKISFLTLFMGAGLK